MSDWLCETCDGSFPPDVSRRKHRLAAHPKAGLFRWRQRRWWGWLSMRMYTLGITSGGQHTGHPDGWIVRNHYGGKRPYVLGIQRHRWSHPWHRLKYGHWPEEVFGFCGICGPWTCCGATGYDHAPDCESA